MRVYKIWCKWDIGQDDKLWQSAESSIIWAKEALISRGLDESYDELEYEGLIGFDFIDVIMDKSTPKR